MTIKIEFNKGRNSIDCLRDYQLCVIQLITNSNKSTLLEIC